MNKLKTPVSEGWIIQIYDQDRRLLCTLEPSHGWTFLAGLIVGLGIAIIVGNLNPTLSTVETVTPSKSDFTAPLEVD